MPRTSASDLAERAGEEGMFEIIAEGKINLRSPSASGRLAFRVYSAVIGGGAELNEALYWADWWSNDGGDLEPVPDGTAPDPR